MFVVGNKSQSVGAFFVQTYSTYELVKKDIDEFSTAVQSEASHLVSATSHVIRDQATNIGNMLVEEPPAGSTQATTTPAEGAEQPPAEGEEDDSWGWPAPAAGEWMSSLVHTVNKVLAVEDTTIGEEKMEIPITSDTFTRAQVSVQTY